MSRSFFRTYGFLSAMLLAIVLGCVLGALWPGATCLAPLGTIFINLMFCIVVPLVFCSLSSSIACMKSPKRAGRIMGTTLLVFIVTGLIAAVIMLFAMRLYPPVLEPWADAAAGAVDEQASVAQLLVNVFTVEDFAALLEHLILSHHGQPEFGAAVLPQCAEAELLSLVDQIDSRMEIYREVLAPLKAGEFSQRVFALDNRRVYKHK